jgi:hypothetical protein
MSGHREIGFSGNNLSRRLMPIHRLAHGGDQRGDFPAHPFGIVGQFAHFGDQRATDHHGIGDFRDGGGGRRVLDAETDAQRQLGVGANQRQLCPALRRH